jgi:hypothetical protein
MAWSFPSTPPYVLMAWYLIKQGDNFIFVYGGDEEQIKRENNPTSAS